MATLMLGFRLLGALAAGLLGCTVAAYGLPVSGTISYVGAEGPVSKVYATGAPIAAHASATSVTAGAPTRIRQLDTSDK